MPVPPNGYFSITTRLLRLACPSLQSLKTRRFLSREIHNSTLSQEDHMEQPMTFDQKIYFRLVATEEQAAARANSTDLIITIVDADIKNRSELATFQYANLVTNTLHTE